MIKDFNVICMAVLLKPILFVHENSEFSCILAVKLFLWILYKYKSYRARRTPIREKQSAAKPSVNSL